MALWVLKAAMFEKSIVWMLSFVLNCLFVVYFHCRTGFFLKMLGLFYTHYYIWRAVWILWSVSVYHVISAVVNSKQWLGFISKSVSGETYCLPSHPFPRCRYYYARYYGIATLSPELQSFMEVLRLLIIKTHWLGSSTSIAGFRITNKAFLWVFSLLSHIYPSLCFNYFRLCVYRLIPLDL